MKPNMPNMPNMPYKHTRFATDGEVLEANEVASSAVLIASVAAFLAAVALTLTLHHIASAHAHPQPAPAAPESVTVVPLDDGRDHPTRFDGDYRKRCYDCGTPAGHPCPLDCEALQEAITCYGEAEQ